MQLMPVLEAGEEILRGGQAVIEGVMMRAPHSYCVAVRKPNGEIVTQEMPVPRMSEKYPLFKYPLLRGLGTLGQAMFLGIKALRFSANASLSEEDAAKAKPEEVSSWMLSLNLIFSFAFFVFLYKFVPLYLVTALGKWYPALQGRIAFKLLSRVILLPVIAGLSYEMIRFAAKQRGSFLATLTAPGLWLQRITTQPPSDQQATVAICALDRAMWLEAKQGGELVIA